MTPFAVDYYQEQFFNNQYSFQIKKEIGAGEKGVVYLAEDAAGHQYALKIYLSAEELVQKGFPKELVPYYFDENGRSRMAGREYELSQILTHSAFVKVFGLTMIEGKSAIVMEYIDGRVLSYNEGVGFQTAIEGLIFALERGYKSSDLYSENAMIDVQGRFKFIDLDSFDKVEDPIEDDTVEESLNAHRFFLKDLLDREEEIEFERISKRYYSDIRDQMGENISAENLFLITDYLKSLLTLQQAP
jgi:serine/threonine protein kinase